MDKWHYKYEDYVIGPLTMDGLIDHIAANMITQDTLIRRDGTSDWQSAAQVLSDHLPAPATRDKCDAASTPSRPGLYSSAETSQLKVDHTTTPLHVGHETVKRPVEQTCPKCHRPLYPEANRCWRPGCDWGHGHQPSIPSEVRVFGCLGFIVAALVGFCWLLISLDQSDKRIADPRGRPAGMPESDYKYVRTRMRQEGLSDRDADIAADAIWKSVQQKRSGR